MTPVQRAFDGTFDSGDLHIEDLQMNHSTANHPDIGAEAERVTVHHLTGSP